MGWRRVLRRVGLACAGSGAVVLVAPWATASVLAHGRLHTDLAAVPHRDVAIVFGAQVLPDGTPSSYLKGRLDAAVRLYRAGVVKAVVASGDKSASHYDEPDAMKRYLVLQGIPAERVVTDPAGFDTYSTCVRAQKVYGVTEAILVSQTYHLTRAVATCRLVGVDAVGYGDTTQAVNLLWREYQGREVLADIKMVWDVAVGRQPTLGAHDPSVDNALGR